VNVEALPYTLLFVLSGLAIGSLWFTLASDLRGGVTRGFVLTMALCIAIVGGLALWTAAILPVGTDIDGYRINPDPFPQFRQALLIVTITSAIYMVAVFMGWDPVGRIAGIVGSVAGLAAIVFLSIVFAPPTWGFPAIFLGLFAGTLALGAVSVAMTWGHWYLTEGALPAWPLRDLCLALLGAHALQAVVVAVNLTVPVREVPLPATPVEGGLLENPILYFRIGVGLIFPIILAYLAYRTTRIRAMQSATGLLYIAMGAVFVGEVLAKGLMFVTGRPT
jgi:hypothetical protein